jgi:Zn-dependent peptidase ImmA (M78 family)
MEVIDSECFKMGIMVFDKNGENKNITLLYNSKLNSVVFKNEKDMKINNLDSLIKDGRFVKMEIGG